MTSSPSTLSSLAPPSISEDSLQVPVEWYLTEVVVDSSCVLGRGSYGTVCQANWHGCQVAAKKLHGIFFELSVMPESKQGILKSFAKELNMLFPLKHPNIVQFFGVHKESGIGTLELSSDTYLIQELMHCALDVRNRTPPRLNLRNVVDILHDISCGLRYLHDRKEPIIHRDLATKNVLLSRNGTAKIADLGVAKILEGSRLTPHTRQPGTELYMPPEVKIAGMQYDTTLDMFSFGVIALELCIGHDVSAGEAFRSLPDGGIALVPETERRKSDFEDLGSHKLKPLIVKCLSAKEHRPNARDVYELLCATQQSSEYTGTPCLPVIQTGQVSETQSPPHETETHISGGTSCECDSLRKKVASLSADNEHLQHKLDTYLKEREPDEDALQEIKQLRLETETLQKSLHEKESELMSLGGHQSLTGTDLRVQRAMQITKLNELQTEIEALRDENATLKSQAQQRYPGTHVHEAASVSELSLRQEIERLQREIKSHLKDKEMLHSQVKDLAMQQLRAHNPRSGPSSLPSLGTETSSELQKMRKLAERYKESTIQLDMQLRNAREDLLAESNRADSCKRESKQLRAEVSSLRSQLHQALQENMKLISQTQHS